MSAKYPLRIHWRIERQWIERIRSLRQIHGQIVVATERTLQHVYRNESSLILVPIRTIVNRRRLYQPLSRD